MDAVHFKVEHLKTLWVEFRVANEAFDRDFGDQSEWARGKLQAVLTEFDKLIQEQLLWKSSLSAEIEDLLIEIEEKCRLFGRQVENVLGQTMSLSLPTNITTRDYLQSIRDNLQEEVRVTRANLDTWLDNVEVFVKELGTNDFVPRREVFETDLSASVVQPVWYKYDTMAHIMIGRRNAFEDSATQLHFYSNALNHEPVDEIDNALIELFKDKPVPKDISEFLKKQNKDNDTTNDDNNDSSNSDGGSDNKPVSSDISSREYVYYSRDLPVGLNLSEEQLAILESKTLKLEKDYTERKERRDSMHKILQQLWNELELKPEEKEVELRDSLEEEYLNQLNQEFERLRKIMREKIEKAISQYTAQLEELWDKCLVPQNERDAFLENLHQLNSAEEVYELLAQEVARLQELYAKCAKIYRLMLERRALIEKMIEFEKKASDPRRLFQSSFRLLEEEKWRKTCWPSLVKIEDNLIKACVEYEENERKPFMHESTRYLDTLQSEIGERIVNQMFFGFEQSAQKGPKVSKEQLEAAQAARRRRDSAVSTTSNSAESPARGRRDSKVISSRAVSPAGSVTSSSRPVSPVGRSNSTPVKNPSRRTSRYLGTDPIPVSPGGSSSRAASPARSNTTNSVRRRSGLFSDSLSNNQLVDEPLSRRSTSESSNSGSSDASAETLEPVNGRLVVGTINAKSENTRKTLNGRPATPSRTTTTPVNGLPRPPQQTLPAPRIRISTEGRRPRPKSVIGTNTTPSSMLKKPENKRMSLVVEGGR